MLALVNAPQAPDRIEFRELSDPIPKEDEALIGVAAFSLNRGELALLASRPEGWRPGQDIAGTVIQPARSGVGPSAGTRVVGLVENAGWAQKVAVPASRLAALPGAVSFEQAAALPIAGLTALRTVRLGGFLLGRRVLVTGASGGVGHLAVQIATLAGAQVTAVARAEHADTLRRLGAQHVVAATDQAEGTFDHILESLGGSSLEAAVAHVASAGTIVLFGNSVRQESKLDFMHFRGHENARLQTYFSYASGSPADAGRDLGFLAELVAEHRLEVELGRVANWRDITSVLAELRDRKIAGKAILQVAS